jgi:hypothetical protein
VRYVSIFRDDILASLTKSSIVLEHSKRAHSDRDGHRYRHRRSYQRILLLLEEEEEEEEEEEVAAAAVAAAVVTSTKMALATRRVVVWSWYMRRLCHVCLSTD